jgi:hypothetical protein
MAGFAFEQLHSGETEGKLLPSSEISKDINFAILQMICGFRYFESIFLSYILI